MSDNSDQRPTPGRKQAARRIVSSTEGVKATSTTKQWRDHPIAVGAIVAAGTTAFWLAVFTQIVIPTHTQKVGNQLESVSDGLTRARNESSIKEKIYLERIRAQANKNRQTEKSASSSQAKLDSIPLLQSISRDTPLPAQYREVGIGEPISRVAEAYGKKAETGNYLWTSVDLKGGPYSRVTYYRLESGSEPEFIYQILFHLTGDKQASYESHRSALTSLYGKGEQKKNRFNEDILVWEDIGSWGKTGRYRVELDEGGYLIAVSCQTWKQLSKRLGVMLECEYS